MTLSFTISVPKKKEKLDKEWDVIIIGGGMAGSAAAIYTTRYRLKTLMITREIGGLLTEIHKIEDYPGFPEITGEELAKRLEEHVTTLGAKIKEDYVESIHKEGDWYVVRTTDGEEYKALAIIFATGSKRKGLGVPGEEEFKGKGVSYCATCDAAFFKDKVVAVVGGGNGAMHEAQVLLPHVKKLYIIHRRNEFRAFPEYVEELRKHDKVEFKTPYIVLEIVGDTRVRKLILENRETGEKEELEVDGIFISIGQLPNSELAQELGVKVNERGYIITDEHMRTNLERVYAAGDVTEHSLVLQQLVTAAAEGAIAAKSAFEDIRKYKKNKASQ